MSSSSLPFVNKPGIAAVPSSTFLESLTLMQAFLTRKIFFLRRERNIFFVRSEKLAKAKKKKKKSHRFSHLNGPQIVR